MIILKIYHDGREWIIEGDSLKISAPTIEEIDTSLKQELKKRGILREGSVLKIRMQYDISKIPPWIRQYSQHYFDRVLEIRA
jgi:hypothetical protein